MPAAGSSSPRPDRAPPPGAPRTGAGSEQQARFHSHACNANQLQSMQPAPTSPLSSKLTDPVLPGLLCWVGAAATLRTVNRDALAGAARHCGAVTLLLNAVLCIATLCRAFCGMTGRDAGASASRGMAGPTNSVSSQFRAPRTAGRAMLNLQRNADCSRQSGV